jgi:hypothetical protein
MAAISDSADTHAFLGEKNHGCASHSWGKWSNRSSGDSTLLQVDHLPKELANEKIDFETFKAAQFIVGKQHRIVFPVRFWQNTKHSVDEKAMRRLVEGACKQNLPDVRSSARAAQFVRAFLCCITGLRKRTADRRPLARNASAGNRRGNREVVNHITSVRPSS